MQDMIDYEVRFQSHERRTAAVDCAGWMAPQRARRPIRAAAAKMLLTLAARVAPPAPNLPSPTMRAVTE